LIDIQINGAYGFDFSVYEGDDQAYQNGLRNVAEKIVETGVTAFVVPSSSVLFVMLTDTFQSCSYLDRE
jgi:N-acetylglucosamine-6-phosphate deacetylase